jgi:hypothetical protein
MLFLDLFNFFNLFFFVFYFSFHIPHLLRTKINEDQAMHTSLAYGMLTAWLATNLTSMLTSCLDR